MAKADQSQPSKQAAAATIYRKRNKPLEVFIYSCIVFPLMFFYSPQAWAKVIVAVVFLLISLFLRQMHQAFSNSWVELGENKLVIVEPGKTTKYRLKDVQALSERQVVTGLKTKVYYQLVQGKKTHDLFDRGTYKNEAELLTELGRLTAHPWVVMRQKGFEGKPEVVSVGQVHIKG